MKRIALFVAMLWASTLTAQVISTPPGGLLSNACVTAAQATVIGILAGSNGIPAANYTMSFAPSQAAFIAGCGVQIPVTVNCSTSFDGSVVGIGDPLATTVITPSFTGALPPGTYFVQYAWYMPNGPGTTLVSPEQQILLTSTGSIVVNPPISGLPAGAAGMKVYISSASGTETLQGQTVGAASFVLSSAPGIGASPQASNTTACTVIANDSLWPSGTGYNVALTDVEGNPQPGYPMLWQIMGPGTTINLSSGLPYYHGIVMFPTPILANPLNHSTQSINGGLNLGAYNLWANTVYMNKCVGAGCGGGGGGGGGGGNVNASGALSGMAIVTGAGSENIQTPNPASTLDVSGNVAFAGAARVGGPISVLEGNCSGAGVARDALCADSISHSFKISLNNGSFIAIPQIGNDLGGTSAAPQVIGILNHALPGISVGFLGWNGATWQFSASALPSGSGNKILATPADGSAGAAALRAMVTADVPTLPESQIANLVPDLAAKAGINQSNTYTTGDQNFSAATKLELPNATAAPTSAGGVVWRTDQKRQETSDGVNAQPYKSAYSIDFDSFNDAQNIAGRASTGSQQVHSNTPYIIQLVGDSHLAGLTALTPSEMIAAPLRYDLQGGGLGDGGTGYISICNQAAGCTKHPSPPEVASCSATVTADGFTCNAPTAWSFDFNNSGAPEGPDDSDAFCNNAACVWTWAFVCKSNCTFTQEWEKKTANGSFSWSLDGAGQGNINTAAGGSGTPALGTTVSSGLGAGYHVISITLNGDGTVRIFAPLMINNQGGGVVVANAAMGSQQTSFDNTRWTNFSAVATSLLTTLSPNLILIDGGPNECENSVTAATFATNLHTQYLNYKNNSTNNPSFGFIVPIDTNQCVGGFPMSGYRTAIINEALADGALIIDLYETWNGSQITTALNGATCAAETSPAYLHLNNACGAKAAEIIASKIGSVIPTHPEGAAIDSRKQMVVEDCSNATLTSPQLYLMAVKSNVSGCRLAATTDAGSAAVPVTGSCVENCAGTSGSGVAKICVGGHCPATFDGASTINDYVLLSGTAGGKVTDTGSKVPPVPGAGTCEWVLGTVSSPGPTSGGRGLIDMGHSYMACSPGGGMFNANGSPVSSPNFNYGTPSADANTFGATYKVSGSNVSAEVPNPQPAIACTTGFAAGILTITEPSGPANGPANLPCNLVTRTLGATISSINDTAIQQANVAVTYIFVENGSGGFTVAQAADWLGFPAGNVVNTAANAVTSFACIYSSGSCYLVGQSVGAGSSVSANGSNVLSPNFSYGTPSADSNMYETTYKVSGSGVASESPNPQPAIACTTGVAAGVLTITEPSGPANGPANLPCNLVTRTLGTAITSINDTAIQQANVAVTYVFLENGTGGFTVAQAADWLGFPSGNVVNTAANALTSFTCLYSSGSCYLVGQSYGAGSQAWNNNTNPIGSLLLTMLHNRTLLTYDNATGSSNSMFALIDTAGNTGTKPLLQVGVTSSSAAAVAEFDSTTCVWLFDNLGNFMCSAGATTTGSWGFTGITSGLTETITTTDTTTGGVATLLQGTYNVLGDAIANTYTGANDFTGASQFKVPTAGGFAATALLNIGIDSSNSNFKFWNGASSLTPCGFASNPTSGSLAYWIKTGNVWTCGGISNWGGGTGSHLQATEIALPSAPSAGTQKLAAIANQGVCEIDGSSHEFCGGFAGGTFWSSMSNVRANQVDSTANKVSLFGFTVPTDITFTTLSVEAGTADASNNYSWGIVTATTALNGSAGFPICHAAAAVHVTGSHGINDITCTEGSVTLIAGFPYIFYLTSDVATATFYGADPNGAYAYYNDATNASTAGLFSFAGPTNMTIPALGPRNGSFGMPLFFLH